MKQIKSDKRSHYTLASCYLKIHQDHKSNAVCINLRSHHLSTEILNVNNTINKLIKSECNEIKTTNG